MKKGSRLVLDLLREGAVTVPSLFIFGGRFMPFIYGRRLKGISRQDDGKGEAKNDQQKRKRKPLKNERRKRVWQQMWKVFFP